MAKNNIPKLNRKSGLYLKDTRSAKGRGVFCIGDIKAGEILEVTPALILDEAATKHVDKTLLENYTFFTGRLSKRTREKAGLKSTDDASSVVMGMVSFCNHGEHPNAEVLWEEHAGSLYYILRATRKIPKNTEICTTYGDTWFDDRA